ncbi:dual specificity protein kinase splB-like [Daktulosphaira vitifoliae]|uniref:dual specificity protein kinase splB-like n=1 Tax=Daktulosphaira vitifoliae TaxID=58002 RepID=UPI0021AAE536|nr:dual specificity protein kinase splB-like [Daktulosphaira vitifoliae]
MGVTIVTGLAFIFATVLCDAFKFSGLDPLYNHARQYNGLQNYNIPPSPQPCYNGFHHGAYQKTFPQFGPFPGYQSPTAYSVQRPFFGQASPYPQSSYRFDRPNPFGFASFPTPIENQYTGKITFNNIPGKIFQEHQFNVHHGSKLPSANLPVDHNIKQYKPKETVLNHPVIPFESLFKNCPKPAVVGFIPIGFTGQHGIPQIQSFYQTSLADKATHTSSHPIVVNQDIGDKYNTGIIPVPASLGETETPQSVLTNNPSLGVSTVQSKPIESDLAQKLEPTNSSPPQEEVNSITTDPTSDALNYNEVPAAIDTAQDSKQNEDQSNVATNEESNEPNSVHDDVESTTSVKQDNTSESFKEDSPVTVEDVKETVTENNNLVTDITEIVNQDDSNKLVTDIPAIVNQDDSNNLVTDIPSNSNQDDSNNGNNNNEENVENVENSSQITSDNQNQVPTENNSDVQNDSNNENSSDQPNPTNDLSQPTPTEVSENDKPADTGIVEQNPVNSDVTSLQNVLNAPIVTASDPNLFSETDYSLDVRLNNQGVQQPLYIYEPVSLIGSNLNTFSNLGSTAQPSVEVLNNGEKSDVAKIDASVSRNGVTTENTVILGSSTSTPLDRSNNPENKQEIKSNAGVKAQLPKKSNTIQIVQEGPVFSGQFPSLYDPSSDSQLDSFKFFDHPSIKAYAGQASMNSYSPETAFTNFDALFKQGYFIEGSPSLTPEANTANIFGIMSGTPMSIASKSHPLHSQVFKYSPSHVPYPGLDVKSSKQGPRIVDFTPLAEPIVNVKSSPSVTTSASPTTVPKTVKA